MVTTMMWLNVDLPLLRCGDGKVEAWGDESSGAHGKMDFQEFPTNSIVPLNQFDLHRFPEFWYLSKKFQVDLKKCSWSLIEAKREFSFFDPKCVFFLEASEEWFLFSLNRLLVVTIGWSLFGSNNQICQLWYCSFPLFDFFQLFPINPSSRKS